VPLATLPPLPTIPLDAPTIIDDADYFDQLEKVRHLPRYLKGARGLRGFYE
jgi:hypothetical protein